MIGRSPTASVATFAALLFVGCGLAGNESPSDAAPDSDTEDSAGADSGDSFGDTAADTAVDTDTGGDDTGSDSADADSGDLLGFSGELRSPYAALALAGESDEDYAGFRIVGDVDLDGNGALDALILAYGTDADGGTVYAVDATSGMGQDTLAVAWGSLSGTGRGGLALAAGDLDGDGRDDAVVSTAQSDLWDVAGIYVVTEFPAGPERLDSRGAFLRLPNSPIPTAVRAIAVGEWDGSTVEPATIASGTTWTHDGAIDQQVGWLFVGGGADGSDLDVVAAVWVPEQDGSFGVASVAAFPGVSGIDGALVGAAEYSASGGEDGAVYLLDEPATGGNLADAEGRIVGDARSSLGTAAAAADLDGDGWSDLVLGAYSAADGNGAVYVFRGPLARRSLPSEADLVLEGSEGAGLGSSVDATGVEGGSRLWLGARNDGAAERAAGSAWWVEGTLLGTWGVADVADAWTYGETDGGELGAAVAFAGDVDADGTTDLWVGAPGEGDGDYRPGEAWLFASGAVP